MPLLPFCCAVFGSEMLLKVKSTSRDGGGGGVKSIGDFSVFHFHNLLGGVFSTDGRYSRRSVHNGH